MDDQIIAFSDMSKIDQTIAWAREIITRDTELLSINGVPPWNHTGWNLTVEQKQKFNRFYEMRTPGNVIPVSGDEPDCTVVRRDYNKLLRQCRVNMNNGIYSHKVIFEMQTMFIAAIVRALEFYEI